MSRQTKLPAETFTSTSAGLVIGLTGIFMQISFAALIFSGQPAQYLSQGTGILLLGALIMGLTVTLTSSFSGSIAMPQDSSAAIMAVVAAAIVSSMPAATPSAIFATVVAAMIFSTVLTGSLLGLLGKFNLGRLVRFMPFPVVGGFLAGTGWLLTTGGISVMTDGVLGSDLLRSGMLLRWIPGFLFAVMLLLMTRRSNHFLIVPTMLIAGTALFYLTYFLFNGEIQSAQTNRWLLGPFPEGGLLQFATISAVTNADWGVVMGNIVNLATICIIAPISLLLNTSGLEISSRSNIDPSRELQAVGVANIVAGLGGSSVGYHMLSLSTLGIRLGVTTRLVGLVSAAVIATALVFGAGLLATFPKMIAGTSLLFLGLAFLTEWLYDARFKLATLDYLLIWTILIVIIVFGMLPGVIVGLLISALLFIYSYSTTNTVRHTLSRKNFQSYVMRPPAHEDLLQRHGDSLLIFDLQGFLFFGSAHKLTEKITNRIEQTNQTNLRFILLDFRLVTGIDSSASLSFLRLKQVTDHAKIVLIITNASTAVRAKLRSSVIDSTDLPQAQLFSDLDQGVAWAEEQIISTAKTYNENYSHHDSFLHYFVTAPASHNGITEPAQNTASIQSRLLAFMEKTEAVTGTVLLTEGEPVDSVYFIEKGQIVIYVELPDGQTRHLRIQEAGTVFGEIGIYSGQNATANVAAKTAATLFSLSTENLLRMETEDPQLAIATHRLIATVLGRKLTQANYAIVALQQ